MLIEAHGKINWTLNVVGRREDGYHLLDTIMHKISLYDEISLCLSDGVIVHSDHPQVPLGEENLCRRAAHCYLEQAGIGIGAAITIHSRIPMQAGLGSASADAAAVLRGLNELHGALKEEELMQIAQGLGADVPFCLSQAACARCTGIGEQLQQVPSSPFFLVIAKGSQGVPTGQLFALQNGRIDAPCDTSAALQALKEGNARALAPRIGNALLPGALELAPEIQSTISALKETGALAVSMSGSGSACFGLYESRDAADAAANALDLPFVQVCHTL